MFDPVFGSIPFVKRQSEFPANPDIFTGIDYLLVSHDHFDHLDKQSIARLLKNNPQMKLFCGLGTGELIQGWFPEMKVIEDVYKRQEVHPDVAGERRFCNSAEMGGAIC